MCLKACTFCALLFFLTISTATTSTEESIPTHVSPGAYLEVVSTDVPFSIASVPVVFKINHNFDVKIDKLINTINKCKCISKICTDIVQNLIILKLNIMDNIGYIHGRYKIDSIFHDLEKVTNNFKEMMFINFSYLHTVNDSIYFELLSKLTVMKELNINANKNNDNACNRKDIQIIYNEISLAVSEFKILQLSCKHQILDESVINSSTLQSTLNSLEKRLNIYSKLSVKHSSFYYNNKVLNCLNFNNYTILRLDVPILPKYFENVNSFVFVPIEFTWNDYICKINFTKQSFIQVGEKNSFKILKPDCKDNNSAVCEISQGQIEDIHFMKCIRVIMNESTTSVQNACPMQCMKSNLIAERKQIDPNVILFSKLNSEFVRIDCPIQDNKNFSISEYPDIGVFKLIVPCYCFAFLDDFVFTPDHHCVGFDRKLLAIDIKRIIPMHWLNNENIKLPDNKNDHYNVDLSEVSKWRSISKFVVNHYDSSKKYDPGDYIYTTLMGCVLHLSISVGSFYFFQTRGAYRGLARLYRGLLNRGL